MYTLSFTNVSSQNLPNVYSVPSFVITMSKFADWRERTYWLVARFERKYVPNFGALHLVVTEMFRADDAIDVIDFRERIFVGELLFLSFDVKYDKYQEVWEETAAKLRRWGVDYILYHPFANYVVSNRGMVLQNELF